MITPGHWLMRLSAGLVCAAALVGGGCYARDPNTVSITVEERTLMERLTRDPFVVIIDRARNDAGFLVVTTQQGDAHVRYLLAPDGPASKQLRIRRMIEEFAIESVPAARPGTGPAPRGLQR